MFTILLVLIALFEILLPTLLTFVGIIYIFIFLLLLFLQVLFFTTCERKILALTQRRLGPRVVGDRGRLQFLADALKLITKTYFSPKKSNGILFQNAAIAAFWFSWLAFTNLTFEYGTDILEVEYNIFFFMACSMGFGIAWVVAGWASGSKYAILGCIRAGLQLISYEILSSSVFMSIFTIVNSSNFEVLNDIQEYQPIFLFIPTCIIILYIGVLMETNRPPFDLSEAESDVVAGYTVEYAGILFGLFYLGEYVNLFTTSLVLSISFWGAWWSIPVYLGYLFDYLIVLYSSIGVKVFEKYSAVADSINYILFEIDFEEIYDEKINNMLHKVLS